MGGPAAAAIPDLGHAEHVSSSSLSSDGEQQSVSDEEVTMEDLAAARRKKLHDFLLDVQRTRAERLARQGHEVSAAEVGQESTEVEDATSTGAKPFRETELHRLKRMQAKLEQLDGEDRHTKSIYELYESAVTKHRDGDFHGAATDWTQVLLLDKTDVDALFGRGQAKNNLGDLPGALEDYSEALAKDPTRAPIWFGLGSVRSDMGDEEGAIADFGESLKLDPTRAEVWGCRATALLMRNDFANAAIDCNKAIDVDESYAGAWGIRGTAKHRMGDHDGAIHDLRKALDLDPEFFWAKPILDEAIEACEHLNKIESIRNAAKALENPTGEPENDSEPIAQAASITED